MLWGGGVTACKFQLGVAVSPAGSMSKDMQPIVIAPRTDLDEDNTRFSIRSPFNSNGEGLYFINQ